MRPPLYETSLTPLSRICLKFRCFAMYLPTYRPMASVVLRIGSNSVRPNPYAFAVFRQKAHSQRSRIGADRYTPFANSVKSTPVRISAPTLTSR